MERYTDTISGEELYVVKGYGNKLYYKDRAMTIYHRLDGPAVESHDVTTLFITLDTRSSTLNDLHLFSIQ